MAQALVLIEQGQLGSGVRPLAAHDDAGAGRIAGQVDHAGPVTAAMPALRTPSGAARPPASTASPPATSTSTPSGSNSGLAAIDLLAWTRVLLLDGELATAEPKKLRYRLLHVAARLTRGGRCLRLRISATWPWRTELATDFHRLAALPRPAD